MNGTLLCIGGAAVDRSYAASSAVALGTSNTVVGQRGFGGVARNVSETLARLGARCALHTVVGDDESGNAIARHLDGSGVDIRGVRVLPGAPTAEYIAVLEHGRLFAAFADMEIFARMDRSFIDALADALAGVEWVFADCNLEADALERLVQLRAAIGFRLAADAVSVTKSRRLQRTIGGTDLVFANCAEAQALSGREDAHDAALALVDGRAAAAVVMDGPRGAWFADGASRGHVPAPAVAVVNVDGAGDALVGGTLLRLVEQASLADAVRFGCACAALSLASPDPVPRNLSRAAVEAALVPALSVAPHG